MAFDFKVPDHERSNTKGYAILADDYFNGAKPDTEPSFRSDGRSILRMIST